MTEEYPALLDDYAKMESQYLMEIQSLEADLARVTRALEETRNDLLSLEPPPIPSRPFYEHPAFVATVGVLTGVGLTFLYVEVSR